MLRPLSRRGPRRHGPSDRSRLPAGDRGPVRDAGRAAPVVGRPDLRRVQGGRVLALPRRRADLPLRPRGPLAARVHRGRPLPQGPRHDRPGDRPRPRGGEPRAEAPHPLLRRGERPRRDGPRGGARPARRARRGPPGAGRASRREGRAADDRRAPRHAGTGRAVGRGGVVRAPRAVHRHLRPPALPPPRLPERGHPPGDARPRVGRDLRPRPGGRALRAVGLRVRGARPHRLRAARRAPVAVPRRLPGRERRPATVGGGCHLIPRSHRAHLPDPARDGRPPAPPRDPAPHPDSTASTPSSTISEARGPAATPGSASDTSASAG